MWTLPQGIIAISTSLPWWLKSSSVLIYPGFSYWCHMAKPWPLAHRQCLSHMAITCQWQGHPDPLAWQEERPREHGAVWGSQPHAQLPCRNTAGSTTMSLQGSPALLHLCRGDKGAWGRSPRGSWRWGSGKRGCPPPTVGTRDVLGKLRRSQFSECPFASSGTHLIWGLISLIHNHENSQYFFASVKVIDGYWAWPKHLPFPHKWNSAKSTSYVHTEIQLQKMAWLKGRVKRAVSM